MEVGRGGGEIDGSLVGVGPFPTFYFVYHRGNWSGRVTHSRPQFAQQGPTTDESRRREFRRFLVVTTCDAFRDCGWSIGHGDLVELCP